MSIIPQLLERLTHVVDMPPIPVAFPECADILLSLIKLSRLKGESDHLSHKEKNIGYFEGYFEFPSIIPHQVGNYVNNDTDWSKLNDNHCNSSRSSDDTARTPLDKFLESCIHPMCLTLSGTRGQKDPVSDARIKRLFIADCFWMYYWERMGMFKMLGAILDNYALKGKFPIANGSITSLILETLVNHTKSGLFTSTTDRDTTYRQCLGWSSDVGRKLGSSSKINTAFNTLFHRFIRTALAYYKDKRLASAIQGVTGNGGPSVATLRGLLELIDLLKKSFKAFDYNRNYSNTLKGILGVMVSYSLIRELRTTIGVPEEYDQPFQYIPAAYDILVSGKPSELATANRYKLNRSCADSGREILLHIEVLEVESSIAELKSWIDDEHVEAMIEGYRTAYRELTGTDLGTQDVRVSDTGKIMIEQQVLS